MRTVIRLIPCLLVLWVPAFESQAADILKTDHVMYRDPLLVSPDVKVSFDPRLKQLWVLALRRPEPELQRSAADTIAIAHQRGMPDLSSTSEELAKMVQRPESAATVRRAAARALIILEAKQHATILVEAANRYGLELRILVEPAIARWEMDSFQETWQQRLANRETPKLLRLLAIEGLGILRDKSAKTTLLELVRDSQVAADHRLAAARSIGLIGDGGVLEDAQRLLANKSQSAAIERVLGVNLLSAQRDDAAIQQLVQLAGDSEPTVAGAALGRLLELDPKLVFPLAAQAVKNADVNVRRIGAEALLLRGDLPAVDSLAPLLDDPNPSMRQYVCKALFDLAKKPDLRPSIDSVTEKTLASEGWRGLEQAELLVGHLDHKPAVKQVMSLLKHPRREVAVTAAWTMGRFKIPETIPELLTHSNAQYARYIAMETLPHERSSVAAQLTQLLQIFGDVRFREADPLLRKFVPKAIDIEESRTAACWALGKIHEGESVTDLAKLFEQRLADVNSMPPEFETVRRMCALGLGRFKAESSLPTLERFATEGSETSLACYWSIHLITGKVPPELPTHTKNVLGWFLQPIDN